MPTTPLVLRDTEYRRDVIAMLDEMHANPDLIKRFTSAPSEYLQGKISHLREQRPSSLRMSLGNRFLYSVLSNDRFLAWAREYQRKIVASATRLRDGSAEFKLDRDQMTRDVATAFLEYGDRTLLENLVRFKDIVLQEENPAPDPGGPVGGWVAVVLILVVAITIVVVAVDHDMPGDIVTRMSAAEMRSLSEQIVKVAQTAKAQGQL